VYDLHNNKKSLAVANAK